MKIREIVKRIYDLRKTRKPFVSNYYLSLQKSDKDFVTWTTDSSIVFCDQEENLLRCYFASVDLQDLNTLFEKVPSDAVMDYIVKEELSEFSWVNDTLFRHYTTLARHTYLDLCGEHEKSKHELFMEQFYEENFGEFQKKYGKGPYMQDMYSAGFYPYPDEESYWGYWSKQALLGGMELDVTPLHKCLLEALSDKNIFVLSTNADGQFVKAGLPEEKIFCTQGDYFHIQCRRGCHNKIYDARKLFSQMNQARKDCKIPSYMVPKCPVCGGPMDMNLRKDGHFVQDEAWYHAEKLFSEYLSEAVHKKLVLLELGVGFNTPTIIRFPFEKLVREHKNISLIRLNLGAAVVPESFGKRAVGIDADMAESIRDIAGSCK